VWPVSRLCDVSDATLLRHPWADAARLYSCPDTHAVSVPDREIAESCLRRKRLRRCRRSARRPAPDTAMTGAGGGPPAALPASAAWPSFPGKTHHIRTYSPPILRLHEFPCRMRAITGLRSPEPGPGDLQRRKSVEPVAGGRRVCRSAVPAQGGRVRARWIVRRLPTYSAPCAAPSCAPAVRLPAARHRLMRTGSGRRRRPK